jgi:hypothetical protein
MLGLVEARHDAAAVGPHAENCVVEGEVVEDVGSCGAELAELVQLPFVAEPLAVAVNLDSSAGQGSDCFVEVGIADVGCVEEPACEEFVGRFVVIVRVAVGEAGRHVADGVVEDDGSDDWAGVGAECGVVDYDDVVALAVEPVALAVALAAAGAVEPVAGPAVVVVVATAAYALVVEPGVLAGPAVVAGLVAVPFAAVES